MAMRRAQSARARHTRPRQDDDTRPPPKINGPTQPPPNSHGTCMHTPETGTYRGQRGQITQEKIGEGRRHMHAYSWKAAEGLPACTCEISHDHESRTRSGTVIRGYAWCSTQQHTALESQTTERQARHTSMQARPATESYCILTSYHAPITGGAVEGSGRFSANEAAASEGGLYASRPARMGGRSSIETDTPVAVPVPYTGTANTRHRHY